MGIPIWCIIASLVVTVRAGLHDVVAHSFYEEPQSSSPTPVQTQPPRPELKGMKEIVLFLTPEQVETLEAAGAIVQPYPEYDSDFAKLQEQLSQSIEQQNMQQHQTWMNPIEDQTISPELQNYYKLFNIQKINDDLSQVTQVTEGITEMTTTPRYKYTKARQQYKEKEYSTPYVPKKPNRNKSSNQGNHEKYIRFLPNYEHEVLQMVPFQALPISPYQFEDFQTNVYFQPNLEGLQNTYSQAKTMVPLTAFNVANEMAQQTAFHVANTVAQQLAYNEAIREAQPNAQVSTEAYQNVFSQVYTVAQQNILSKETTEAQPNTYSQENVEGPRNVHSQTNMKDTMTAFTEVTTEAQKNTSSQETTESQKNARAQANKLTKQTTLTQVNSEPINAYSVEIEYSQKSSHSQANTEAEQKHLSQANIVTPQYAFSKTNTVAQETTSTEDQSNAYPQTSTETQQNVTHSQANIVTQKSGDTAANTETYIETSTKAQQNAYTQKNRENQRNVFKSSRPTRIQVPKVSKKPQGPEKVVAPVDAPKPTGKTYFISQGTKQFKETLSSIEGLAPLTLVTPLEKKQEKPETPPAPAPTVRTPNKLHQDKVSLLLAPLYQHQTITDTISRQKEELLKCEFNIRTKLQKMKESPEYYDQQEYTAELEKLTRNYEQQNTFAKIEASTVSNTPMAFVTQGLETTESDYKDLEKNTEIPILYIPKSHDVKTIAPRPVPLQYMRPFRVSKPIVGGTRPVEGVRNVYVKLDKPFPMPKYVPLVKKQKIPAMFHINPEQLTLIRHIWEH